METAPFLRGVLGLRFTQAVRGCAGARCCLRGPSGEIILILGEDEKSPTEGKWWELRKTF